MYRAYIRVGMGSEVCEKRAMSWEELVLVL